MNHWVRLLCACSPLSAETHRCDESESESGDLLEPPVPDTRSSQCTQVILGMFPDVPIDSATVRLEVKADSSAV